MSISYQLGLLDFPFDLHGEDTRYFNSEEEQQEYFENKIRNGDTPFMPIEAPNLDSLFITSQVYQENSPLVNGQFNISNKNYAVIKVTYTGIKIPDIFITSLQNQRFVRREKSSSIYSSIPFRPSSLTPTSLSPIVLSKELI